MAHIYSSRHIASAANREKVRLAALRVPTGHPARVSNLISSRYTRSSFSKVFVSVLFWLASSLCIAAQANNDCVLTMGWEPWKPYQFVDDSGELTGYDIDLVKAVVEDMDCTLRLKQINWARGVIETKSGSLDMMAHADFTEERNTWALFSDPYRDNSIVLYVRKGESEHYPFASLQDIVGSDFRLGAGRGVYLGDAFEELLSDEAFRKQVFYIDTDEMQQYRVLKAKRVDGFLRSKTALDNLRKALGEDADIEIHPLPIFTSKQHVMFSRKNITQTLVDRFNASLTQIRSTGVYADIEAKYFE